MIIYISYIPNLFLINFNCSSIFSIRFCWFSIISFCSLLIRINSCVANIFTEYKYDLSIFLKSFTCDPYTNTNDLFKLSFIVIILFSIFIISILLLSINNISLTFKNDISKSSVKISLLLKHLTFIYILGIKPFPNEIDLGNIFSTSCAINPKLSLSSLLIYLKFFN